jgi:cation:H+ antiporter
MTDDAEKPPEPEKTPAAAPAPAPASAAPQKKGLARAWHSVSGFYRDHKSEFRITGLTGALMGTTALVSPLLTTTLGAGAVCAAALWLLVTSGDMTLNNIRALGQKMNLSTLTMGLGLGALASLPELMVTLRSAFTGATEIGIGNLVGANVAHVFLILGATAAIAGIKPGKGLGWKFNMAAMTGATLGFAGLLAGNMLTPFAGAGMVALAAAYLGGNYYIAHRDAKKLNVPVDKLLHDHSHHHGHGHGHDHDHGHDHGPKKERAGGGWMMGLWTLAGLGSLLYSADVVVDTASAIALNTGVSAAVIGSLGVALGSALPEGVISVKSALRGDTEMAVGNILGCNIFNILFVGGALSLANAQVPASFGPGTTLGLFNLAALGTSAVLMSTALTLGKGALKKWQGYAGLAIYGAYCATVATLGGGQQPDLKKPEPAAITQRVSPPSLRGPALI